MESALRREEMQVEKYIKLSICFCFLLFALFSSFSPGVAITTQLADSEVPVLSLHTQNSYNI